jgi:Icc-related predicted phosphoesterase
MKINYISDIHLEFDTKLVLPGADILIVAGDMCELRSHRNKYADGILKFMDREFSKYDRVLYVMGNHEYYHSCIGEISEYFEHLPKNVTVLSREYGPAQIGKFQFVGCTLWTDFNRGNPLDMISADNGMHDYRCIKYSKVPYRRWTPYLQTTEHLEDLNYLKSSVRGNPNTIVITHHGPSAKSIHGNYVRSTLNYAYISDLEYVMQENKNIALWFHGHVHNSFDYMVNKTRVLCNPKGYMDENHEFNPSAIVEI